MSLDFTGTWKADLAVSRLHGPPPTNLLVSIAHSEPDLQVEMSLTTADQKVLRIVYGARTTNEEVANTVLGNKWLSRSRWVDDELLIESWVSQSGRVMHFRDYWSLAGDGRILTMEHRDDDLAGQVTVLDKIETEPIALHPRDE